MTHFEVLNNEFPRLGRRLFLIWGTKESRDMLCELINDTREGTRRGFPDDVATAIICLLKDHDKQFPEFNDSKDYTVESQKFKSIPRSVKKEVKTKRFRLYDFVVVATVLYATYWLIKTAAAM